MLRRVLCEEYSPPNKPSERIWQRQCCLQILVDDVVVRSNDAAFWFGDTPNTPRRVVPRKLGWKIPDWVIKTPGCLIWLIPLTLWPQMHMPGLFGPGTAIGIFPWGAKLGYYGVFFFFGMV